MLPKVNNKSFLKCNEEDLKEIINNPDFKENEFIDYKENFAFLEIRKENKKEIQHKIVEFRNDVCAFANAEGGYLIFGISEDNGSAKEILGINIADNDIDKFELDIRNKLAVIQPKTPYIEFNFIELMNGNYVVVIYVKSDNFAPYTHIENETNYKMYKRSGNGKKTMTYMELKNMFIQSLSLDKEIYNYRKERINYYNNQEDIDIYSGENHYKRFLLLHIIPETFLDSSYNHNMFLLERKGTNFSSMFGDFYCATSSLPCVDGLRYIPYKPDYAQAECHVNNNGIIECFLSLHGELIINCNKTPKEYLPWGNLWEKFKATIGEYIKLFKNNNRVFLCISLIGCKDVASYYGDFNFETVKIDRNTIVCSPVCIENLSNETEVNIAIKKLYIEFLLSIGVKNDDNLSKYIKEVNNA